MDATHQIQTFTDNLPVLVENLIALGADPAWVYAFQEAAEDAVEFDDQALLQAYAVVAEHLGEPERTAQQADRILCAMSVAETPAEIRALV